MLKYIFCIVFLFCVYGLERGDRCSQDNGGTGKCELFYDCIQAMSDFENGIKPKICGFDDKMPIVCCTERLARFSQTSNSCYKYSLKSLQSRFNSVKKSPNVLETTTLLPVTESSENMTIGSRSSEKKEFPHMVNTNSSFKPFWDDWNSEENVAQAIGGKLSEKREFPHMAALGYGDRNNTSWMCGGSLISEHFVLTAAHCLVSRDSGPVKYVRLGDLNLYTDIDEANPQDFTISKIYRHPGYAPPNKYHDIALLKLNKPAAFNDWVRPACLHTDTDIPTNVTLIATGWGFTEEHGNPSDHLIKVTLQPFTTEQCKIIYKPQRSLTKGIINENMFCAGSNTEEKGTCFGDSGGPIQMNTDNINDMYSVVGVTSFGRGCAYVGMGGVYVRVSRYLPWIENIVWPSS